MGVTAITGLEVWKSDIYFDSVLVVFIKSRR